jgi:acyl dehydratase
MSEVYRRNVQFPPGGVSFVGNEEATAQGEVLREMRPTGLRRTHRDTERLEEWVVPEEDASRRAPKEWRGRFYEDIDVGDVYQSRLGRTITDTDNVWMTLLTMNSNQMHFNVLYAARTQFGRPLVNSGVTIALVLGMTVPDTSENAAANLAMTDIKLSHPVYVGDTIWVESEMLDKRESRSNPDVGIITMRSRGINDRSEVVLEFKRTFMIYKRDAPQVASMFPDTDAEWTV